MFITFEGIDGSGKSTQIGRLKKRFLQEGRAVSVFREPGGTEVSEKVREVLLSPAYDVDPVTELLLFSSARSQLMAQKVLPELKKGNIVILDRFYDSTTAYQGYGRESVPLSEIRKMNSIASHKRAPDLTVYMKISLKEARKRMVHREKDRMEQADDAFFEKVVDGYETLARSEDRFFSVDATQQPHLVHNAIWKHIENHFP